MRYTKFIAIISMLLIATKFVQAQEAIEDRSFRIGVGIRGNTFTNNDFNFRILPPARFYTNFDIMKYARVDFQMGMYKRDDHQLFANNYSMIFTEKTFVYAFGLFGMYKVDKINFYGGLRFGRISYSSEDHFYAPAATTPTKYTNSGLIKTTGIIFAGEYFIGTRFSISGEVSYALYKDKYTPGNPGLTSAPLPTEDKLRGTEAALVFRFYPL